MVRIPSADLIEAAYAEDQSAAPVIHVDLQNQEVIGRRWPCIILVGSAYGVRFTDCDLRGADLSHLTGAEYVGCALFGAKVAEDAQLTHCNQRTIATT